VTYVQCAETYNASVPHDPELAASKRRTKVAEWIDVLEETARELELELLSRRSETASEAGADPDPRLRPCEHRTEWHRGRLCLACDNTGLRPATSKEREDGMAFDPYLLTPPRAGYAVTRDQSEAALRARDLEQLSSAIEVLERNARIREGQEVHEGELAAVRLLDRLERGLGRDGRKVAQALGRLQIVSSGLYRLALARDDRALDLLAQLVPGKLRGPVT
jgi:hypothetical protein